MGIKEAIYLLEREGLRVAFSGTAVSGPVHSRRRSRAAGRAGGIAAGGRAARGAPPGREIRCVRRPER